MKIFVAGPMTDVPKQNKPAFTLAAALLRDAGFEVTNPAEPHPDYEADMTWDEAFRVSLRHMLECDGVALLPGWEKSRLATLERTVAMGLTMPIRTAAEWAARRR